MVLEKREASAVFDPFKAMDMLDDAAILAELEGQVVDKWVYHFPQEGKEVWGLSKVGVDQACREMALQGEVIREEDVFYQLDPTDNRFVLFKAFASRVAVSKDGGEVPLDRVTGTKRQCVFQVTQKEGITNRPNAFWFEQGSIKALRNTRLRLISEEIRAKIMSMAKSKGKVTEVKGEKQQPATKPEPAPQPLQAQNSEMKTEDNVIIPPETPDSLVTPEDIVRLDTAMRQARWDNMRFGKYAMNEKGWVIKSKKDLTKGQLEEAIKDILKEVK